MLKKTSFSEILKIILISGIILIILDSIFLYFNKKTFEIQIADVQRVNIKPRPLGFILCYAILILGLYWFILRTHRPIWEAIILGFLIYGVYETTNYGTLKKWKIQTVLKDTLWGGALFGSTTFLTYMLI
jgi:uncharacterized membrane protein